MLALVLQDAGTRKRLAVCGLFLGEKSVRERTEQGRLTELPDGNHGLPGGEKKGSRAGRVFNSLAVSGSSQKVNGFLRPELAVTAVLCQRPRLSIPGVCSH